MGCVQSELNIAFRSQKAQKATHAGRTEDVPTVLSGLRKTQTGRNLKIQPGWNIPPLLQQHKEELKLPYSEKAEPSNLLFRSHEQ